MTALMGLVTIMTAQVADAARAVYAYLVNRKQADALAAEAAGLP